jgi:hypothetical protein
MYFLVTLVVCDSVEFMVPAKCGCMTVWPAIKKKNLDSPVMLRVKHLKFSSKTVRRHGLLNYYE